MISLQETWEMLYHEPQREMKRKEMKEAKEKAESMSLQDIVGVANNRPDWDSWFMTLCFVVAQRSLDKDTKHGCIVVDDSNTILSIGYNSPPRGCADAFVPLERPAKYDYMKHSEENAIVNAARSGICLKGSTFYITGPPCHGCFGDMINVGAKKIVHGPAPSSMLNAETDKVIDFMKMNQNIQIVALDDVSPVFDLLSRTSDYVNKKLEELK